MPGTPLWQRFETMQYTGSNKADILAMMNSAVGIENAVTHHEAGPTWFIQDGGSSTTMNVGDLVVVDRLGTIGNVYTTPTSGDISAAFSTPAELIAALSADPAFATAAGASVRAYGGTKAAGIPAAVSLAPGTRTVAVTWPRTLPASWATAGVGNYDVDISPDVGLLSASYTYSVTGKTLTGCTLNYTNAALILSLAAGTVDLTASK